MCNVQAVDPTRIRLYLPPEEPTVVYEMDITQAKALIQYLVEQIARVQSLGN